MKEGIRNTLVFDVKDLRHEDFKKYEALVPPETLGLMYEEAEFVSPLSCTVLLLRQGGNNICVTADITSVVLAECRRCVKLFEIDIATSLNLFFFLGDESSEEDEADAQYYDGETLDISEDAGRHLFWKYRCGHSVLKHAKDSVHSAEQNSMLAHVLVKLRMRHRWGLLTRFRYSQRCWKTVEIIVNSIVPL